MRNIPDICIKETTDSIIKFQERRSIIKFSNQQRRVYKRVKVDGCALLEGEKCDCMLCSADEHEERYIELKGSDIPHAIEQLRTTIQKIGEYKEKRHSYVVCTKVAPQITTLIQKAKVEFRNKFKSELQIKEMPVSIALI